MRLTPPELGDRLLIVLEPDAGACDALRAVASALPRIQDHEITVLCCCPTHYWEHGGTNSPETLEELQAEEDADEMAFERSDAQLQKARDILYSVGASPQHVHVAIGTEDSVVESAMAELKRRHYTGVIVSRTHADLVNRLLRRGITDAFRHIPDVTVWAIEPEMIERHSAAQQLQD